MAHIHMHGASTSSKKTHASPTKTNYIPHSTFILQYFANWLSCQNCDSIGQLCAWRFPLPPHPCFFAKNPFAKFVLFKSTTEQPSKNLLPKRCAQQISSWSCQVCSRQVFPSFLKASLFKSFRAQSVYKRSPTTSCRVKLGL